MPGINGGKNNVFAKMKAYKIILVILTYSFLLNECLHRLKDKSLMKKKILSNLRMSVCFQRILYSFQELLPIRKVPFA